MAAKKKDGSLFDVRISARMITDERGDPAHITVSFADITDRQEMREIIRRSEKLSSLGLLSAGLAHELRNLLAVISSCAQFCVDTMNLPRLATENLQMIYRNSQRANILINDLLQFAGPSDLERTSININEIVTRIWQMAKLEKHSFQISFETQLEGGLPDIIGDEDKLGQVFFNLFQNAIEGVSKNGSIKVSTRFIAEKKLVDITIIDDGYGVPAEYYYRVFDPFFTTKDGGSGLGLSICHSIVRQHKGTITVEGAECGTKVSVRLPLTQNGKD